MDDFLERKNNFEQIEKKYKIQLQNKDRVILQKDNEIVKLENKIALLDKTIKNLESQKKMDEKSKSISTNNCNQGELNDFKKSNCTLTQQNLIKNNIRNMKQYYNNNNSSLNNNSNNNKINISIKNIENNKKLKTKKLLLRNMSTSNIEPHYTNINYSNNKKNLVSNYNNKNSSINESISNYLYKINESELNNISRDNSYNKKKYNKNSSFISDNNKLNLKLPVNITNNNYNMNKNNVMINVSTNIVSDNINNEKMKVEQKLIEYQKLIDRRIDELMNNKKRSTNQKKERAHSKFNSEGKHSFAKNYEIYKKVSISSINSEQEKKAKKKYNNISNTSYKYINNEYFQNIRDKNIIIPKKMNACNNKRLINNNSQNNIKNKQISKNKINIVSKNVDIKSEYYLGNKNDEDNKGSIKNIHDQITSKGNDEEKSEDSKK